MTSRGAGPGDGGLPGRPPVTDPWARWAELDPLFEAALDLPAGERDAYVAQACAGDAELERTLRRLLAVAEVDDDRLARPGTSLVRAALDDDAGGDAAATESGRRIGRYRIGEVLGRGGMATVYDAERDDGVVAQRVAIKLIHRGLDSDEVVRRFLAERHILSGLEHPHIARLIDGGATDDGRPWLAMERVAGEPITDWADRRRLTVRERIALFLQVAEAVQFAHRRLVVHRDLKPSNILVDADGSAKLLDFGIAKLLDPAVADDQSLTRTGVRPLTPAYASPEQLRGDAVTTASDVYQLGALLYVLLAGRRPFAGRGPELEAAITTGRLPRPSDAAATAPDGDGSAGEAKGPAHATSPAVVAAARRASIDGLRRALRDDLDAIVLKAMRTEPERRYASAAELADDLRRHLDRQPVLARPDSLAYRARRFAARHPAVAASALLVIVISAAYIASLQQYARRVAAERDRAQVESAKAQQIATFVQELFAANDPDGNEGVVPTAFDMLERGEARVGALAGQPAVQAEMASVIGSMYTHLGQYDRAEPLFRQALELRRALEPVPLAELATTLDQLGDVLQRTGRLDEAETLLRESLETARLAGNRIVEANAWTDLGQALQAGGDYDGAEAAHRSALAIRRELLGERHERTALARFNVAVALEAQERPEESESLYLQALADLREAVDPEHSWIPLMLTSLARLYSTQGELDRSQPLLEEALALYRTRLGPTHVRLGLTLNELGFVAARRRDFAAAEAYFRESLAIREEGLGPQHPEVATALNNISYVLIEQGRVEDALPLRRRVVAIADVALGSDHRNTGLFRHNLAHVLDVLGRDAEAEAVYREALDGLERALPEGHAMTTRPLAGLGRLLTRNGRAAEAERVLRTALARRVAAGEPAASIGEVESLLGAALAALGRGAEAGPLLEKGHAALEQAHGPDAPLTRAARERLAQFRRSSHP